MEQVLTLNTLIFVVVALVGAVSHALKKWWNEELQVGLLEYFFKKNVRSTLNMLAAALGGTLTGILAGTFTDPQVGAQVIAVWGIGWAANSSFNKQE